MQKAKLNGLESIVGGVFFSNPLVLSSGIMGLSASSLLRVSRVGAGGVTSKSCGLAERKGHPCPNVLPFAHGLLNAIGLSNPGVDEMVKEFKVFKSLTSTPLIASIFGGTIEEFGQVTERVVEAKPDFIEVNISCPNVSSEFGAPFGADPDSCAKITKLAKTKAGKIPVAVKLTPNCTSIGRMAKICEDNGADLITAINTVGPGMLIDINVRKPVLANKVGGVSGPAIFPIAVRCIWDIFRSVKIPIVGGGGVTNAEEALQLIMAGASLVGIGSGVYPRGLEVFTEVQTGMNSFLSGESFSTLIGAAHG